MKIVLVIDQFDDANNGTTISGRRFAAALKEHGNEVRVIARPFVGNPEEGFHRTANRHDFSLEPPAETMLDAVKAAGLDCLAVGKIHDIFAGHGDTEYVFNKSNADGMAHTDDFAARRFNGLCFVNLVDFDMAFGHRRDIDGYANALSEFDAWLLRHRLPEGRHCHSGQARRVRQRRSGLCPHRRVRL